MKVWIVILLLIIFLMMYMNVREGFDQDVYIILRDVRGYPLEAPLSDIKSKVAADLRAAEDQLPLANTNLNNATNANRNRSTNRTRRDLTNRKNEVNRLKTEIKSLTEILKKLEDKITKGALPSMSLGDAISAAAASNTMQAAPAAPEPPTEQEIRQQFEGVNNPALNIFVYLKNKYNFSNGMLLKDIVNDLSKKDVTDQKILLIRLNERNIDINTATLGYVLNNIYLGPQAPLPTIDPAENIFVTLKRSDVSKFFGFPPSPLWQINMVLTMSVEAFVELSVYIESIPTETTNPYVMRKDDIEKSLGIASNLLDRLTYQYEGTSTVKRDAELNTVLSVPETPIPEFVPISSSHNYASSFIPTESK